MKAMIFAAFMLISTLGFAQDGYHSYPEVTCEGNESCLISRQYDNMVLKLIAVEDEAGDIVGAKLSSDSFLADTVYKKADVCFKGNAVEVCDILEASSNADGGDGVINTFKCVPAETIKLDYQVEYYGYGSEDLSFEIKKCE